MMPMLMFGAFKPHCYGRLCTLRTIDVWCARGLVEWSPRGSLFPQRCGAGTRFISAICNVPIRFGIPATVNQFEPPRGLHLHPLQAGRGAVSVLSIGCSSNRDSSCGVP